VLRDPALWIAPVGFCVFLAVLIFIRHHANISRLLAGTEPKIGAKKASAEAPASAPE
jgi:glycerol-3-phosphate acyltransferase PlsY